MLDACEVGSHVHLAYHGKRRTWYELCVAAASVPLPARQA